MKVEIPRCYLKKPEQYNCDPQKRQIQENRVEIVRWKKASKDSEADV